MDALLSTFVAVALIEQGDRMQALAIALRERFGRPGAVIAGMLIAILAGALVAAGAGRLTHDMIPFRALSLLVALAMLSAGATALFHRKAAGRIVGASRGAFAASLFSAFATHVGSAAPFLVFALAARTGSPALAAAGATFGSAAAILPGVLAGEQLRRMVPLPLIRRIIGGLFVIVGAIMAIGALRLI